MSTEAKTNNQGGHDAVRSDEWQSSQGIEAAGDLTLTVDFSLRRFRTEAEIHAINYALGRTAWNRKRAAKLLGISYRGLLYKIRRHNLAPTVEHY